MSKRGAKPRAGGGASAEPGDRMKALLAEQARRREAALAMGGPERIAAHHASGRLTARERIERLVDPGSWYELGLLALPERRREEPAPGDAVITGLAKLDGRPAAVLAIDATVLAGTTAQVNMRKQRRIAEWAGYKGLPLICLSDADGGRMPDVMGWRFSGLPFDFRTFVQPPPGRPATPRASAALGPSFGDAALHAAMSHFVVMTEQAALALSGPPVVASAIGEELTAQELGGPDVAAGESGVAHLVVETEDEGLAAIRRFLSYLPSSAALPAPTTTGAEPERPADDLLRLVPADPKRGYDMRRVIAAIVDDGSALELRARYGRSLITALARLDGQPVGVVASQPMQRAGVLDEQALAKELAFADLCDTFNVPLVFLHDVPGLMIGRQAERGGILPAYERIVARLARATVPKVGVVIRKSYGGGHFAMGGRPTHPDVLVSWPTAELGFMAPDTGVRTVYRRRLEADPGLFDELAAEWSAESEPWEAAAHLYVDDVIDPRETRATILTAIDYAWGSGPRVREEQ
jgi:acetyl-CoA carboxylase carboxyltransferase component